VKIDQILKYFIYKPIGIFLMNLEKKSKQFAKTAFFSWAFFYTTYEKTKSERKYLMNMTEY
jgi:hypothetical protein